MGKKIGILTFHKSLNYGSALQAFALVQKLRELGYDAEVIDYKQNNYDYQYKLLKAPVSAKAVKYDIIHMAFLGTLIRRAKAFPDFCEKYLYLGKEKLKYGDDLSCLSEQYDTIICGSDQIWNPNARDFDTNYFLPDIQNVTKVSYAVSINGGSLASTSVADQLKKNLLAFHALSVREESGRKNLNDFLMGEREVSVVLDPTLLHNKEKYDAVSAPRLVQEPYIFFYSINFMPDAIQAAENLSKRTGLPVYTLFAGRGNKCLLKAANKFHIWKKSVGPEAFISLLKYSDYVVTNSFHGTAFSIIYEKNFYSVGCAGQDGQLKYDERICDGLAQFGLLDRVVTKEQIKDVSLDAQIDYQNVGKIREELIQESVNYLKDALK